MPKFAVLPQFPVFLFQVQKLLSIIMLAKKKQAAFSTAVIIEELCQHVLQLGYQSPNTTTGISSSLPETLIGLAATNLIGH